MNNKPHPQDDFNSPYQQPPAFGREEPGRSIISEDEKETLQLPPDCPDVEDLVEGDLYPYQPFDSVAGQLHNQARSSTDSEWGESTSGLELDQLNTRDQIIIETTHSVYHFTVVNPKLLYGELSGGILGNQIAGATLKFSCSEHETPIFTAQRIKLGMSLVFNLEWGDKLRQLITSTITRLMLRTDASTVTSQKRNPNSAFITLRIEELEG